MSAPTIFDVFPPAALSDWEKAASHALKGAPLDRLTSATLAGIDIAPLYTRAAVAGAPALRVEAGPWRVAQRLDHPDPDDANVLAIADLEGGADALTIVFDAAAAQRFGLCAGTLDALDAALRGVMPELISIRLDAGHAGRRAASLFAALVERHHLDAARVRCDFGYDPIGVLARTGKLRPHPEALARTLAEMTVFLRDRGFGGAPLLCDSRIVHEAGGSETQELAYVIASAVGYLRLLEQGGLAPMQAQGGLAFLLAADADQFMTIAKFRALRRLWARIEEASGLGAQPVRVHAETAWRMMTKRDPWVNILRATTAGVSAGIGGADSVTLLPFTLPLGLPDAAARRIARNAQLLLIEEAGLAKVEDPAGGAGAFEALTDALCEKAWALFQDIERAGGIVADLRSGTFQARIAQTAATRQRDVARRKLPLTGTSEFAFLAEAPVAVLPAPPPVPPEHPRRPRGGTGFEALTADALGGGGIAHVSDNPASPAVVAPPLPSRRDSALFEALRDRADARLSATGARPRVFLACLGALADFSARAGFARNLFAAGGIEAVGGDAPQEMHLLAQAFAASGARLACLCGSDGSYAADAPDIARALAGEGAHVMMAGRPGAQQDAMERAGVKAFIYAGGDAIAALETAWALIET